MRRTAIAAAVAAPALLLVGCADQEPESGGAVVGGEPVPSPYEGPMFVEADYSDNAEVLERSGAAGLALECDFRPYAGGGGDYDSGLESAQDSPASALDDWLDHEGYALPHTGYRVERDDGDRVLLSYDVRERTRIAVIVADGIRDWDDEEGWGVESWAECDPAELPASVADELGIGVWTDEAGRPVPVARIVSYAGPEHCDWQDITFLTLDEGDEDRRQFLRDTTGELGELLRTTYDAHATLPRTAIDTGLRRDGRQLWLAEDGSAAYLVSVDDSGDVERWPAAGRGGIACG